MPTLAKAMQHSSRVTRIFVNAIRALMMQSDSYRPELHYMRGPGPKWHAKNAPASASFAGARTPTSTSGAPEPLLRYPKWALIFRPRFTGFPLLHHQADRLAEAKFHIWR
jgi:hypothetical protein